MTTQARRRQSRLVSAVYQLLNPIPFSFFVAGLIFDAVYFRTAELMWSKSAAWLITIGLFFAIIPRVINLLRVWLPQGRAVSSTERIDFALNLAGIVAAIFNAFVHSRDAYAVMPAGLYLSVATVALIGLGTIVLSATEVSDE